MPVRPIALALAFLLSPAVPSASQSAATWPDTAWTHSSPEAQGMSSAELSDMLERMASDDRGIRSITLVRHGVVVLDVRVAPFAAGDRHEIHSCTKSVLSALVGIAIDRGELPGTGTPVLDFFPEYDVDDDKRAITLEHLLTMTAGLETEDSYLYNWEGLRAMRASRDWARYVLDLPLMAAPGTRFEYSNGVSQLIAIILERATGQTLEDYAREHLFGPIGIADFEWEGSGPHDNWGYSGLQMRPLDMARLGYLYLHGGQWNGEQVVPAKWVEASTSAHVLAGTLAESYGYQWWVDEDVFMMQGYGGQFVYVVPGLDLVAVFTSAVAGDHFFYARSLLANAIVPSVVADDALPPNPDAAARLDGLANALADGHVEARPVPAIAHEISGRRFDFDENRMGLYRMVLSLSPDSRQCELRTTMGMADVSLSIGLDGAFRTTDTFRARWACRGEWVDDRTFVVEQEAVGKVLRREATFIFRDGALKLKVYDRINNTLEVFNATVADTTPAH